MSTTKSPIVVGGSHKGACPLVGGAAWFRRGGNPPAPAFPRETGKGINIPSLLPQAVFALRAIFSHPPIRPASIRTLLGALRSGVSLVFFIYTGAVYLQCQTSVRCRRLFPGKLAVTRTRRFAYLNSYCLLRPRRVLPTWPDCDAMAHTLRRSPTIGGARPLTFAPPPQ
jgi:hypothetical protein